VIITMIIMALTLVVAIEENVVQSNKRDIFTQTAGSSNIGYNAYSSPYSQPITSGFNYLYVAPFICGKIPHGDSRYINFVDDKKIFLTSINPVALADTKGSIQLSFNFPPAMQFEVGVVTNSKPFTLVRRTSFTLDCSELLNPSFFDRGNSGNFSFVSGYALIESKEQLVVYDFLSISSDGDIEFETLEIKGISLPNKNDYNNYGNQYNNGGYSNGQYGGQYKDYNNYGGQYNNGQYSNYGGYSTGPSQYGGQYNNGPSQYGGQYNNGPSQYGGQYGGPGQSQYYSGPSQYNGGQYGGGPVKK